MDLQTITIDFVYLALAGLGDVLLGAVALLVLLAMIDGLISGLQLLNRGD